VFDRLFTSISGSSPVKRPMMIRHARLPYASDVTKGSVDIVQSVKDRPSTKALTLRSHSATLE
jgi:hypothetical protein